jgi:ABC-type sugar transport system substrate-binding protein
VITTDDGSVTEAMVATATEVARRHDFTVRSFTPSAPTVAEQARLIGDAIAARARAIVMDPINYSALLPFLRAAHDAGIPVVLVQTPRDTLNPTFVASFVAPNQNDLDTKTATEITRWDHGRDGQVAVLSAGPTPRTSGASLAGLRNALDRARTNVRLLDLNVDAMNPAVAQGQVRQIFASRQDLTAVVAVDAIATQALDAVLPTVAHRPRVIVTTVNSTALELLSRSLVDAVIGADTCVMTRTAMVNAMAAAKNDAAAITPGPTVAVRTLTRTRLTDSSTLCR